MVSTAANLPDLIAAAHRLHLFSATRPQHFLAIDDELEFVISNPAMVMIKKLPTMVGSRLGTEEDLLAFVLQHAQLLPRYLLVFLNSISNQLVFRKRDLLYRATVGPKESFSFKYVYEKVQKVCRPCIPELRHVFLIEDLERVFRSYGKVSFESDDFS